jgi:hypothetical protein
MQRSRFAPRDVADALEQQGEAAVEWIRARPLTSTALGVALGVALGIVIGRQTRG